MTNKNLNAAKKAKNDAFYTRLEDIQEELNQYTKHFKGKVVYCNCDDPTRSNFWIFFHMNFNRLGLKKLIATHYNMDGSPSYAMTYDSKDPKDDINFDKGTKIPLKGDGDFRSEECIELLKQSDMVVTNPPFSLFREFVAQLEEYNKEFIIIGNKNAITYKKIFPLIKDSKLWFGFSQPKEFNTPNGMTKKVDTRWFTNVDVKKPHHNLETAYRWHKHEEKYPDLYPKYDNYDAIEVSKVLQIPLDYDGAMGVPITFLDVYNPDQFEVLGLTTGRKEFSKESWPTKRYINALQHKSNGQTVTGSKANTRATIAVNNPKGTYYTADNSNKKLESKYARILIKNKHPEDYQNDL